MKRRGPRLILASASPRRKIILRKAGVKFHVQVSHVSERAPRFVSSARLVTLLALKKAKAVSKIYPNDVVLGADTLVFINGHAVGKPRNASHARRMLRELSGRWQRVYTGVAVVWEGGKKRIFKAALSRVRFRKLTEGEIAATASKHLDKAGAYAVQEKKDGFVSEIRGDYDNVVGLPMRVVKPLLRRAAHSFSKRFGYNVHFQR